MNAPAVDVLCLEQDSIEKESLPNRNHLILSPLFNSHSIAPPSLPCYVQLLQRPLKMCRICGRVVKCIFDTMPSRTYQVPSRRYMIRTSLFTTEELTRRQGIWHTSKNTFSTFSKTDTSSSGLSIRTNNRTFLIPLNTLLSISTQNSTDLKHF